MSPYSEAGNLPGLVGKGKIGPQSRNLSIKSGKVILPAGRRKYDSGYKELSQGSRLWRLPIRCRIQSNAVHSLLQIESGGLQVSFQITNSFIGRLNIPASVP